MKRKKQLIVILVLTSFIISGCGGMGKTRDTYSFDYNLENSKNCSELLFDIGQKRKECQRKQQQVSSKNSANVAATAVGVVIFWPALFFIDGSGKTNDNLGICTDELTNMEKVATQKGCDLSILPPVEEVKLDVSDDDGDKGDAMDKFKTNTVK